MNSEPLSQPKRFDVLIEMPDRSVETVTFEADSFTTCEGELLFWRNNTLYATVAPCQWIYIKEAANTAD